MSNCKRNILIRIYNRNTIKDFEDRSKENQKIGNLKKYINNSIDEKNYFNLFGHSSNQKAKEKLFKISPLFQKEKLNEEKTDEIEERSNLLEFFLEKEENINVEFYENKKNHKVIKDKYFKDTTSESHLKNLNSDKPLKTNFCIQKETNQFLEDCSIGNERDLFLLKKPKISFLPKMLKKSKIYATNVEDTTLSENGERIKVKNTDIKCNCEDNCLNKNCWCSQNNSHCGKHCDCKTCCNEPILSSQKKKIIKRHISYFGLKRNSLFENFCKFSDVCFSLRKNLGKNITKNYLKIGRFKLKKINFN